MSQQSEVIIRYWPHPNQMPFHRDRYKVRYRACFCGTGSGKTIAGVFEIISILLENAGAVGYIFEPTYKMVRRILVEDTLQNKWLLGPSIDTHPVVSAYRRGDNCIEFRNDSILWFGSLEEPQMAEGPNIDVIHVDEAQYIRRFSEAWDVILRRLRGSGRTDRDITCAFVTTTPPPLLPGERLYEFFEDAEKRNPLSKVYRWTLFDNPHTSEEYKQEIVASHHGSLAKRFIEGRFAPAGMGSFDYDSTTHELKQVARDKIKEVIYGLDFGWTNPSALVAVGFDGDNRAYILDEFYQNRVQLETIIQEAKLMQEQWGKGPIYCDRSEPQAIDHICRAGLNARPDQSKRDDGIHELGGRFHVQEDKRPRIYVVSSCVNWIHEVMVYDAEKKENDHAMDATRYAIMNRLGKIDVGRGAPKW